MLQLSQSLSDYTKCAVISLLKVQCSQLYGYNVTANLKHLPTPGPQSAGVWLRFPLFLFPLQASAMHQAAPGSRRMEGGSCKESRPGGAGGAEACS